MFGYSSGGERSLGKRIGESSSPAAAAAASRGGRGYHHVAAADLSIKLSSKLQQEDSKAVPSSDLDVLSRSPPICHGMLAIAGRRRQMEDAVSAVPAFLAIQGEGEFPASYLHHFFGVYNGLETAEFCKKQLHLAILDEVMSCTEDPASSGSVSLDASQWERIIASSFSKIDAKLSDFYSIMNQTDAMDVIRLAAVVVILNRQQIIIANRGESRAILCRRGKPIALSKMQERKIKSSTIMAEPVVDFYPRTVDDEFLILGTPGLWNVITTEIACEVVSRCLSLKKKLQRQWQRKQKQLQQQQGPTSQEEEGDQPHKNGNPESGSDFAAAFLVKLAFSRGSNKNISVVVVDLKLNGNNNNKSKE